MEDCFQLLQLIYKFSMDYSIWLFVDNAMHYYRTYVKILNLPAQEDNIGYILHCKLCGHRSVEKTPSFSCELCNSKIDIAGPLWIGKLFDKEFVKTMLEEIPNYTVSNRCEKTLQKCLLESDMPGTYRHFCNVFSQRLLTV